MFNKILDGQDNSSIAFSDKKFKVKLIDKKPDEKTIRKTYNTEGKITIYMYIRNENNKLLSLFIYFVDKNGDFIMDFTNKNRITSCGFDDK